MTELIDVNRLSMIVKEMRKDALKNGDLGRADALSDVFLQLCNATSSPNPEEWVRGEERTPKEGTYIACIAKRNPFSAYMPMVAKVLRNGWVNPVTNQYIDEATHWMPLPEPPEGKS